MIYGDFTWWLGIVEDCNDPEKIGRYKVRILGYHTEDKAILPTEDLPWAMTVQPTSSAAISGIGNTNIGLVAGSTVVGFFTDSNETQLPIIMGSIGGVDSVKGNGQTGFQDPSATYPLNGLRSQDKGKNHVGESSLSRLARGGKTAEKHISLAAKRAMRVTDQPFAQPSSIDGENSPFPEVKPATWSEPHPQGSEESKSEYPYNNVHEYESGHIQEFDDTPGSERIHTYHKSGSFVEFQPDGSRVQKIVGDDFEIVYGNKTLHVEGNLTINVTRGDVNIKVDKGDVIEDYAGSVYSTIRGGRYAKVQGNDMLDVISDQKINISGSRYTVINCATSGPQIMVPVIGPVPAGSDVLLVKGAQATTVANNKTDHIGGKNAVTSKGKTQFTVGVIPNQQGFAVTTVGNIDLAGGSTSAISISAGQTNIASLLNTNIDTGGILTITTVGAMAMSSAAAAYTHAATTMTAAGFALTSATFTTTGSIVATGDVVGVGTSLATHVHGITGGSSAGSTTPPS